MSHPHLSKIVPLLFYLLILTVDTSQAQVNQRRQRCLMNGNQQLAGECIPLADCQYVISDLRAGIKPKLCPNGPNNAKGGKVLVCCPTQERISAKKCRDMQTVRHQNIRPLPFLPQTFVDSTPGREDGEVKCQVQPSPFIANGRDAKLHEFPYMVALGYGDLMNKKWSCGGTLISENFVLTAAHCIDTSNGRPRRVLVGELYLQNPANSSRKALVGVTEIIVHPDFRRPLKYNDIALLKLSSKLKMTKAIIPACLPQPTERLELIDKQLSVAGWGTVGAFGDQSNILQTATLDRRAQNSCNAFFMNKTDKDLYYPEGLLRSQMCAEDKKHDTCRGDSGGPVIVKKIVSGKCTDFLIGLTSFGSLYCGYGQPGVYTNVQSYLDWIEEIVWPNQ